MSDETVKARARREMWETEDDIGNYPGLQRRAVSPEVFG